MSTLYVTETGVQVHAQGQRLLIKQGQDVLQDIPLIKVDRVILMGRGVSITTPALYALARRKVGVFYLNSGGRFIMRTVGQEHGHSQLRFAQARAVDDPRKSLEIARAIVDGKVKNQRVLVQRHAEGAPWARKALDVMDKMRRQVSDAKDLDELRGREGLAAKEYFGIFRQLIHKPKDGTTWGFERRAYYPPTDPINALLSFGYTLLLNDLVAACQISGLDPDLGFFHGVNYNKPSMALDLEEEFRPVIVDSIVLTAINRHYFGLRDFEAGQPYSSREQDDESALEVETSESKNDESRKATPILMTEEARKRFINLYETRVNEGIIYPISGEQTSYRRIFELQSYAIARVIMGQIALYAPFTIR